MKYLFVFLFPFLASCGSNSYMCEFISPDEMTENQLRICEAMYKGANIYVN